MLYVPASAICLRMRFALARLITGPRSTEGSVGSPRLNFCRTISLAVAQTYAVSSNLYKGNILRHELVVDLLVDIDALAK